ncbi:STAS domain-containing protein [Streptomyces carpinensis]|uniref:Anti-sigma factor antagonist n=1 Tax=Streptomyces carpinensis TaxID=66369 RepID=A0ABV1W4X0_9ACTN|nr:STAS domain-containing protein [Streptomyces carpinensis]
MRTTLIRDQHITVSYDVINGWTVLEIDGEVDIRTHAEIRTAVARLLDQGHRHFVLDLCFVPFLDSMGLSTVVAITKHIRKQEGSLRITCPSAQILKVFRHGGLRGAYEFYDSPQEATSQPPSHDGLAYWPGPPD